jgi:hypothetical protein
MVSYAAAIVVTFDEDFAVCRDPQMLPRLVAGMSGK